MKDLNQKNNKMFKRVIMTGPVRASCTCYLNLSVADSFVGKFGFLLWNYPVKIYTTKEKQ
jgi:nitrate reductase NapE component